MGVTICELDLTKLTFAAYRPDYLDKIGPFNIKMTLDSKDVIKVVEGDSMLQAEMVEAGQEALKKFAKVVVAKELKKWDQDAEAAYWKSGLKSDLLAFAAGFEKEYEKLGDQAGEEANTAIEKVWKEYAKTDKALLKYRLKMGVKLGLCVVGVAAGVAVAATAAVGNVPAIIAGSLGAAKALSTAMQTAYGLSKSATTIYCELYEDLEGLVNNYDGISKKQATAQELFAKAVEAFTSVSLTSIKSCESKLGAFKAKLSPFEKEVHAGARELNKLLDATERIQKEINDSKIVNLIAVLKVDLEKLERSVSETIDKIGAMLKMVKQGRKGAESMDATLTQLRSNIDQKVYKVGSIAIDLTVLALDIWGGDTPESAAKFCADIAERAEKAAMGAQAVHDAFESYHKKMT